MNLYIYIYIYIFVSNRRNNIQRLWNMIVELLNHFPLTNEYIKCDRRQLNKAAWAVWKLYIKKVTFAFEKTKMCFHNLSPWFHPAQYGMLPHTGVLLNSRLIMHLKTYNLKSQSPQNDLNTYKQTQKWLKCKLTDIPAIHIPMV